MPAFLLLNAFWLAMNHLTECALTLRVTYAVVVLQIAQHGVNSWRLNLWNLLDVTSILLFALAASLVIAAPTCYEAHAKTVLSVNSIVVFFRFGFFYALHKQLGPKLLMIQQMLWDVAVFLSLLVISIAGFGVADLGLSTENAAFSLTTFYQVFYTYAFRRCWCCFCAFEQILLAAVWSLPRILIYYFWGRM